MDLSISPDTIGTIIAIIAPGYFVSQTYNKRYAKPIKDTPTLLIECVVFGSILVGIYNVVLDHLLHVDRSSTLSPVYFVPLLVASYIIGWLISNMVGSGLMKRIAKKFHLPDPDEDFLRSQLRKLDPQSFVTVALKSGEVFSGTSEGGSTYDHKNAQLFYFNNVAWYNEGKRGKSRWDQRPGSVIISTEDILYIETDKPLHH